MKHGGLIFPLVCYGLISAATPAGAGDGGRNTVAVAEFDSRLGSYASTQVACDISTLLLADLSKTGEFAWVERSDLDEAASELMLSFDRAMTSAEYLEMGRWVGADFLLLGELAHGNAPGAVLLRLEVVDPLEADLGELFLLAFATDQHGTNEPDRLAHYIREILNRNPHSFWRSEAEELLARLQKPDNHTP